MKKFSYKIEPDNDPVDPREWDNLGTMHCWHSRYNLGDVQHSNDSELFIAKLGGFEEEYDWTDVEYDRHKEAAEKRAFKENIILPLYLYDHSGITMNTSGFSCGWDSGQVGWIVVSIEKVKKEFKWKKLTKSRREEIRKYLRSEVETYDKYLTGDVWGYIIQDDENNDYDSCWGYFGSEYCKEDAESALEWQIEEYKKEVAQERADCLKSLIRVSTGFVHA